MSKERLEEIQRELSSIDEQLTRGITGGRSYTHLHDLKTELAAEIETLNSPSLEPLAPLCDDPNTAIRMSDGRVDAMYYDCVSMGTPFAKNVMILHDNHTSEVAKFMTLVNMRTGERVRVNFPEHWQ